LDRPDPQIRLKDYEAALAFYLSDRCRYIDRLVFVDNSNSDISSLRELSQNAKKEVEFLSFDGLDHPPQCGRTYGEFKLIDYAINHSRLLAGMSACDTFWKVTGRYRVVNLDRLIATAPERFDIYVDLRSRRSWCDLRTYACSIHGYKHVFYGHYQELNETVVGTPEVYLYGKIRRLCGEGDSGIVPRFRKVPRVEGICAFRNYEYMKGKYRIIYWCRVLLNSVAPWLDA